MNNKNDTLKIFILLIGSLLSSMTIDAHLKAIVKLEIIE